MIQRIQSLYLVLVFISSVLCFAFPIARYDYSKSDVQTRTELNLIQKNDTENGAEISVVQMNTLPLIIIISVVGILSIASIFLYKNRKNQIRCVAFTMIFDMIYIGLIFLHYVDQFSAKLSEAYLSQVSITYHIGSVLPIISLIFLFIANKGIKKDEALIRSADRLR